MTIEQYISNHTGISGRQVAITLSLLTDGNTIPFISRYRKDQTGHLDETQVGKVDHYKGKWEELIARKKTILDAIKEQGKLTEKLLNKITETYEIDILEDLYLPYKRKKKTKADKARENGLEPLSKIIMAQRDRDIERTAGRFVSDDLDTNACIEGALDIVKEWISENEVFRKRFRETYRRYGYISSKVVKSKKKDAVTFKDYFDHSEKLDRIPSHRYLALMRGETEGLLRIKFEIDNDRAIDYIFRKYLKQHSTTESLIYAASKGAFKDYIQPGVETQIRKEYKDKADDEAIKVFVRNLEQLLLAPPLGPKNLLAIDPGFRSGCKIAVVDQFGQFQKDAIIFPHEPQQKKEEAEYRIHELIKEFNVEAIAIGNGTASRETKTFIDHLNLNPIEVYVISESGASIYSASEIAREEFPHLDLTVRGAISLARRLQDPLSELVKVDPKSIGVGQYQHDVNQSALKNMLQQTVISCVNRVGVDLNTSGYHLLSYVSGLGPALAKNIVEYRNGIGGYKNLKQLKDVPRLGSKAFEQCAGFLRIKEGEEILDNTGIHPESYHIVKVIAQDKDSTIKELMGNKISLSEVNNIQDVGNETLKDILKELYKPGLDPRGRAAVFEFSNEIKTIEDVKIGMVVPGIVTNITNFGAFVDIGVKQDGLIHISQISHQRVNSPMDVLSLQQKLEVKVIDVDVNRNRINLSLKDLG